MTLTRYSIPIAVIYLFLAGCGGPVPQQKAEAPKKIEPAPDVFRVQFETSKGSFVLEVTKAWAPRGAERFWELVQRKFYDEARFFRVVRNFVVQFGLNGDPKVSAFWQNAYIADDPVKQSNKKGTICFAKSGPGTRTTQVFISLRDNSVLDKDGFAPFGTVVEGMDVVEGLYSSYGDGPPRGTGPEQDRIHREGNAYLEQRFPRLDHIIKAKVVQ